MAHMKKPGVVCLWINVVNISEEIPIIEGFCGFLLHVIDYSHYRLIFKLGKKMQINRHS
jgi:hypothetical protein